MNIHTCTLHEKVGQSWHFCTSLINPTIHMLFRLYICLWILFLYSLTSVYLSNRAMPKLQHACPENRTRAPIGHVWDILWCNTRSRNNVRARPQMFAALLRVWVAIFQNEIRKKYLFDLSLLHCLCVHWWRSYLLLNIL